MSLRILYCSNYYPPHFVGGAELTAHQQALALSKRGHEVRVFAGETHSSLPRHSLVESRFDGLTTWRVRLTEEDFGPHEAGFHKPAIDNRFAAVLDEFRPDIVHLHNTIGLSLGMIALARERGAKVFLTVHDHWGFCFKNTLLRDRHAVCGDYSQCARCLPRISAAQGRSFPMRLRRDAVLERVAQADRIVSPSHYLAAAYIRAGAPAEKFVVVPYGIDLREFAPKRREQRNGSLQVGFAGYLGEHKGPAVLIEAASQARRRDCLQVRIVGDGHLRPDLERMVRDRRLEGVVQFLGKRDNWEVRRLHAELDVLVVPSVWPENSPVTIYESLAAGTVVVASRSGGIPELVEDGVNGVLFEPGRADQLAAILDELVENPALTDRISREASESAVALGLERAARRLENLYVSATRRDQPGRAPTRVLILADDPDPACVETLESCDASPRFGSLRFLWSNWFRRDSAEHADVVWIADRAVSRTSFDSRGLPGGMPLVVPSSWPAAASDRILGRYSDPDQMRDILCRLAGQGAVSAVNGF